MVRKVGNASPGLPGGQGANGRGGHARAVMSFLNMNNYMHSRVYPTVTAVPNPIKFRHIPVWFMANMPHGQCASRGNVPHESG